MQKAKKSSRQSSIQSVVPTSSDVLAGMSEEEMITHLRFLNEGLDSSTRYGHDVQPWEVEIAYVRREQQIRRQRREAFDVYVNGLEHDYDRSEAGLPVADLDNSAFTELF